MNTFKRKALSGAILGGLAAAAGSAHAVYQDPNGLGQALIYPYYTVQSQNGNAFNTYMSIVNTTSTGKALKVRFREGKNSREVLDFNLFLSPNDVWTAALVPTDATATAGGRLITADTSCTNPAIPAAGIDFRNYAYVGAAADNAGAGVDRTREGYLEILEMATVNGAALTAITHIAGTPANCSVVRVPNLATTAPAGTFTAPSGGLSGTYTLINVASGADAGGNAVAFSNFRSTPGYTDIGDETYNLQSGDPVSVVVATQPTGTTAYLATWTNPVDAVSATMMHTNVINEYVLDATTRSNTDWVVTFPTKRFYVTTAAATTPFTNKFLNTGACEPIGFTFFNREELGAAAVPGDFSPAPPAGEAVSLCWESTVMSMRNGASHTITTDGTSGVLGSKNTLGVTVGTNQNGWANLTFTGNNAANVGITSVAGAGFSNAINVNTGAASTAAQNYRGLPVIGFMVRTLFNGSLNCSGAGGGTSTCQGSYGSAFDHKYIATITPAP